MNLAIANTFSISITQWALIVIGVIVAIAIIRFFFHILRFVVNFFWHALGIVVSLYLLWYVLHYFKLI